MCAGRPRTPSSSTADDADRNGAPPGPFQIEIERRHFTVRSAVSVGQCRCFAKRQIGERQAAPRNVRRLDIEPPAERRIEIDDGAAFGIGGEETDRRVLDIGNGPLVHSLGEFGAVALHRQIARQPDGTAIGTAQRPHRTTL